MIPGHPVPLFWSEMPSPKSFSRNLEAKHRVAAHVLIESNSNYWTDSRVAFAVPTSVYSGLRAKCGGLARH